MMHWENIWSFKTDRFTIECSVAPEDVAPEDCFEFQDDIDAIREGRLEWFTVRTRVLMDHQFEVGCSYLGACAYQDAKDFIGDGYFRDMIREAISETRAYFRKHPTLRAA